MPPKPKETEGDDDPYETWTPDQPIPDEDGELEAKRRVILERRTNYLREEAEKKKKKKKTGLFG
jgi:hypothetical protein